jgi:hypothetical protein
VGECRTVLGDVGAFGIPVTREKDQRKISGGEFGG